jgi:hypothetical protein
MLNKKKYTSILVLIVCIISSLVSCKPLTIEQQIEKIVKIDNFKKNKEISFSLADTLSTRPIDLLFGINSNPKAVEGLKNMLTRYSKISNYNTAESIKALECVKYMTLALENDYAELSKTKVDLIIYGLQLSDINDEFLYELIKSAKSHKNSAMISAIEAWFNNKSSRPLLETIKSFEDIAINYLSNKIVRDTLTVELLARLGKPAVDVMIKKMKDKDYGMRFAAGSVLVKMLKYEPNALEKLTSAIDQGGHKIIANNYPFYIKLGQSGTETLLLKALDLNFSLTMGVDFLNCGNFDLSEGSKRIAKKYGYNVIYTPGSSSGPKWGSGN